MCARHIYGNLARVYPGRSCMKGLFWAVAKSFNIAEYEEAIKVVKKYDIGVYETIMMKNPQSCSRVFFSSTSCCENVQNNFSESYNNAINKAREMPLVEMFETIRRQAMVRIDLRRKKSLKHKGKYSLKVVEMIEAEEKHRNFCQPFSGANGWFEVVENGAGFKVHGTRRTCSCRKWDMTEIPCRYALRVIMLKKFDAEDYVSDWYLTSTWQNIYSDSVLPLNGMRFWRRSGESRIQAPPRKITQGPKKKQKRIKGKHDQSPKKKVKVKGVHESPKKKIKVTKEGRIIHCGHCGLPAHNATRCSNVGITLRRKPKKSTTSLEVTESMALSQQSQNSHHD